MPRVVVVLEAVFAAQLLNRPWSVTRTRRVAYSRLRPTS